MPKYTDIKFTKKISLEIFRLINNKLKLQNICIHFNVFKLLYIFR